MSDTRKMVYSSSLIDGGLPVKHRNCFYLIVNDEDELKAALKLGYTESLEKADTVKKVVKKKASKKVESK